MLINRNISVGNLRTSIRLEPEFWDGLSEIAMREGRSIDDICTNVDRNSDGMTRTAAIRVFIAKYFQTRGHPVSTAGNERSASNASYRSE